MILQLVNSTTKKPTLLYVLWERLRTKKSTWVLVGLFFSQKIWLRERTSSLTLVVQNLLVRTFQSQTQQRTESPGNTLFAMPYDQSFTDNWLSAWSMKVNNSTQSFFLKKKRTTWLSQSKIIIVGSLRKSTRDRMFLCLKFKVPWVKDSTQIQLVLT